MQTSDANNEFDVANFLDENGFEAVAETCFSHVESSLDSGVRKNMIVEMPLNGCKNNQFWLATIDEVFGSLLRLIPVGVAKGDNDIWHDLNKDRLYPLGYCQMNKLLLEPPDKIKESCPSWPDLALQYLEDIQYETISQHHIDGNGVTPADRLKKGMILEVQNKTDPFFFWPATIVKNQGGFLTLKYMDTDLEDALFYTSFKLFPHKYADRIQGKYLRPDDGEVIDPNMMNWDEKIEKVPEDIIVPYSCPEAHQFVEGDYLEVIPEMSNKVYLARIDQISNEHYFQAYLVSNPKDKFLFHTKSNNIFPVGWSKKNFDPQFASCENVPEENLKFIPNHDKFVKKSQLEDEEFEKNQKLEIFYKNEMKLGTIISSIDSILLIQLESDDSESEENPIILVPNSSTHIFPLGWSSSNDILFNIPEKYLKYETKSIDNSTESTEILSETTTDSPKVEINSYASSFGPCIVYFNYQCYSSSFVSKARLAQLPKCVGPGLVEDVLHKALQLLIKSSYKSGASLKKLEIQKTIPLRENFVKRVLKGKSKVMSIKANVEIPTLSSQVKEFCREICVKMGACPYLMATQLYQNECPAACQSKPKSEFHAEEQSGIIFRNRNRKGRRKRAVKNSTGPSTKNNSKENSGNENGSSEISRENSRSTTPDNIEVIRKKHTKREWDKILPKSEIRTRGTKIIDFPPFEEKDIRLKRNLSDEESSVKVTPRGRGRPPKKRKIMPSQEIPKQEDSNLMILESNPEKWTTQQIADLVRLSESLKSETYLPYFMIADEIDGMSFMLLDYDLIRSYWRLSDETARNLVQLVESLRHAFIIQYQTIKTN